jgi:hypothetical protein
MWTCAEITDTLDDHVYNILYFSQKIVIPPLGDFGGPVAEDFGSCVDIDRNGIRG